ncbi:MAG TPA: SPFH domain-containing protein, partial [Rhodanobacter sp.]|nr:SPFH domain-containing protein [Rhodanobacter sp.]
MHEHKGFSLAGIPMVGLVLVLLAVAGWRLFAAAAQASASAIPALAIGLIIVAAILASGFFQVAPNEARVLQLFGKYAGSVRDEGLRWTNPLCTKRKLSLRVRNFESGKLKVNDLDGNPIEIAAVVVWQVVDSAEAVFCVDDYENFVHIQSESALRQMAQNYPYDAHDDHKPSLRSHGEVINNHLR